jgi:uncharacterized membrane protein (TIGR02234 family)
VTPRRELGLAAGGCLLSGSLILLAGGRAWARLALPLASRSATGRDLAGSLAPWGLVALAGVVAIAAPRRWGRLPVGLALAASGVAVMVVTGGAIHDLGDRTRRALPTAGGRALAAYPVRATAWPYVAFGAGVVLALSGLLVAARGPRWAALGARYAAPADRPRTDADLWSALDRGEDPTA